MSIKILMPALSPTMKEGNLSKWLIQKGDRVKAGDVIAEIETDKATMEIEAVDEGTVTKILFDEGTEGISVNTPIAILNDSSSDEKKEITKNKEKNKMTEEGTEENTEENMPIKNSTEKKVINKKNKNIVASPYVRKIAKDKNIDLNLVKGSGPKNRIIKRDFENLDSQNLTSKHESFEASSIRKIIAEKTTLTKNTVPHFYLTIESEVDKLLLLRKKINEKNIENKVSINDIFVKALGLAQSQNPQTNVSWSNGRIVKYSSIDVSIAVALEDGLITPIVKNADLKGLLEISNEIKNLILKAKQGKLTPDEYNGGTISISNLGMFGINEFAAIINPPQSCILAVGAIQKIPKVENEELKVVNIIKSTLSADHRVLDGAVAAKLLKDFNDIIQNPFKIWLHSDDLEII